MSGRARPASMSSIRSRRRPPRWRTESHAAPAAQTLPRCSRPDGVGASRPTIIGSAPAIPSISSPYERNIVSIVPTAMDQATSPRARVSLPPRVASAGPGLRSGVVNCAAYEDGVRVADVEVADVRRGPDHAGPLRLDRHVRAGRGAAARGPARVRPARSRRRGRPQRAPAAQVRGLRRLAVRGPAHGADERRAAAHPVRRDARLRRQELRRVGAARLAAVARRPAHPLRGDAGPAVARARASSSTR